MIIGPFENASPGQEHGFLKKGLCHCEGSLQCDLSFLLAAEEIIDL
jgi:hypothetical protein